MKKLPVLCVLIFFASNVVREVNALKEGDSGVCVIKISTRKTKKITFTKYTNKRCGARKCVARSYKTQVYMVPSKQLVCCSGYEYEGEYCAPHCSVKCTGTCVAPDTCRCNPPEYLHPEFKTCVKPTCDPPCINGHCVQRNTCECNEHFESYNATTCQPKCSPGFILDDHFNCIPSCEPSCINGRCKAPNTCSCIEGYATRNDECQPICDDCANGECVAPNTCACSEGFSTMNGTCMPQCHDCTNGVCIAPETCTCLPGFSFKDGVCTPICDSCVNGNCVAPNTCVCSDGYDLVNSTFCVLKCSAGYSYINGSCKPVCEEPCVNGFCAEPNVCACNEGYFRNETSPSKCFKLCQGSCNGTCNEHGECSCITYVK